MTIAEAQAEVFVIVFKMLPSDVRRETGAARDGEVMPRSLCGKKYLTVTGHVPTLSGGRPSKVTLP